MKTRLALSIAGVAFAALALTACSGDPAADTTPTAAQPTASQPADQPDDAAAADVVLGTAETELGTIVVDGSGFTVYMFDNDTQGGDSSACAGGCLSSWPPVPGGDDVSLDGVTGEVSTITATDGSTQLTLNGWPLYYWAGDAAAGDTTGQGVNDVWWVLDPAGEPIR